MNILITGINGMLGTAVYQYFSKKDNKIFGIQRNGIDTKCYKIYKLDLTNKLNLQKLDELKDQIDIVIHCAANVNVNACEEQKNETYNLHVNASQKLAQIFSKAKFFYISTDSVYEGVNGGYNEESNPTPKNYYAQTKFEGESKVMQENENSFILRTNLYGYKKPFGNSLFEWAYQNLSKEKDEVLGFSNVYFNPLFVGQLAEVIFLMVEKNVPPGIYNLGGSQIISKFEFVCMIKELFGFQTVVRGAEIPGLVDGVPRPLNTSLNLDKISKYIDMSNYSVSNGLLNIKAFLQNEEN